MDETFSSIDLATTCLLDSERTETFGKVIHELVKPGHIVLDVGTGPGIMALFAARAGAKKVYAIESNPYTAKIATQNIENNNLSGNFSRVRIGFYCIYLFSAGACCKKGHDTGTSTNIENNMTRFY